MENLKDYLDNIKTQFDDKKIKLEDFKVIQRNKNGTINCAVVINGKKEIVNYIDPKKIASNTLTLRYGKKEASWQKDYWYVVEEEE